MIKAYIFLAKGFEEVEALTVVDLLRRAGFDIHMVSIAQEKVVTGAHNITVISDSLFEENDYQDADILILPGGMPGTSYLNEHEGLEKLLHEANSREIKLAAICAAPSVFGNKGLLVGKEAISYPGFEEQLKGAKIIDHKVVHCGNIITSKALGTAIDFSLEIIKSFMGEEKSQDIKKSIFA